MKPSVASPAGVSWWLALSCVWSAAAPLCEWRYSSSSAILSLAVRDPAGVCSPGDLSPPRQPGLTCVRRSIWQIRADAGPRRALAQHIGSRHLKHLGLFVCICSALGEQTVKHCPRGFDCWSCKLLSTSVMISVHRSDNTLPTLE